MVNSLISLVVNIEHHHFTPVILIFMVITKSSRYPSKTFKILMMYDLNEINMYNINSSSPTLIGYGIATHET